MIKVLQILNRMYDRLLKGPLMLKKIFVGLFYIQLRINT
jgi:hypothetical protein